MTDLIPPVTRLAGHRVTVTDPDGEVLFIGQCAPESQDYISIQRWWTEGATVSLLDCRVHDASASLEKLT